VRRDESRDRVDDFIRVIGLTARLQGVIAAVDLVQLGPQPRDRLMKKLGRRERIACPLDEKDRRADIAEMRIA
jgi:hypothetical protein